MKYTFKEVEDPSCDEIARSISNLILGCKAVNTSFDSGRISKPDWELVNGFPVTPVISEQFISTWPVSHDAYCDEWWIFDSSIPANFDVTAFCNYLLRIADYKQVDYDGFCPLDRYLERFSPKVVFGNNEYGYCIIRD